MQSTRYVLSLGPSTDRKQVIKSVLDSGKNERRIGRLLVGNEAIKCVVEEVLKMQGLKATEGCDKAKRKRKGQAALTEAGGVTALHIREHL